MSKIEWTDKMWNPVTGCTKVSAGCKNCYAEKIHGRLRLMGSEKYQHDFSDVRFHPETLEQPLHWRKPRRVFVNSMSDLFHEDVPDLYIAQVFAAMAQAHWHTYQVLTKRIERAADLLPRLHLSMTQQFRNFVHYKDPVGPWPLPNVWLCVSVEDQATADERIPLLLQTPAAVRGVSLEPMLAPVDLWSARFRQADGSQTGALTSWEGCGVDWVIVGGESGPRARPMHPGWARSVRDQCVEVGVPFFFKQWGEWAPYEGEAHKFRGTPQRVGKKAAGRELDGKVWDQYPNAARSRE